MSTSEIKALLDEQGRVFEAFKAAFDEKHGRNAEEIEKLNGELDRLADRIDETRAAMRRSNRAEVRAESLLSPERKAFAAFLRKGKENVGPDELKVLLLADDTAGGYLAPSEMVQEIIKGEAELSPMRTVARVRQTTARTLEIPRRTGQFSAVWTGEIESRSETEGLAWGLEEIPTHELTAEVYLSQQMLEDAAVDLEMELTEEFGERFAVAEGAAIVSGNGVKKPEGFLDHADVAETVSGSTGSIADADGQANGLIDLYHDVKTAYARNGTWLLNRFTLGEVRKLKDIESKVVAPARQVSNALLERKTAAELDLMREVAEASRLLREEADRFDKAKCHAGLPALRAFAGLSASNRAAVLAHCGLDVEAGRATLRAE